MLAVTNTSEAARVSAVEQRERLHLVRVLEEAFGTAYRRVSFESAEEALAFVGVNEQGPNGPADSVSFLSTAPITAGGGLPGDIKEVKIFIGPRPKPESELAEQDQLAPQDEEQTGDLYLLVEELPLLAGAVTEFDEESGELEPGGDYEVKPLPAIQVASLDIAYYDGEEWQEEWNSAETGLLPWAVRIRINYPKSDEEKRADLDAEYDPEEDADFQTVIPVPAGIGMITPVDYGMFSVLGTQEGANEQ